MKNRHAITGLCAWLLLAAAPGFARAEAPAFDCTKASGEVEKLICRDDALAALDRRMATVYAEAMTRWPRGEAVHQRAFQRGWIKGRNDCWKSTDVRACVEESYRTRLVELEIRSGQLVVPKPIGFSCSGEPKKPFFVAFYRETDPPSAVITYGDDQAITFVAPSASGARYTAAGVEFWEHQGEASVDWFGTKLRCKPRSGPAASRAPTPLAFDRVLVLQGITFHVSCPNDTSMPTATIVPSGLEIRNDRITREVDGTVVGAEVADLNADGSPEVYVFVRSAGSGSYGSLVAYSANARKSLSEVYLPPVAGDPRVGEGYMGHDEFVMVEGALLRRFPVYRDGDTNAKPTGGTRQLEYKLVPGETGWVLRLDDVVER